MELVAENHALSLSKGYKQTEVGLIPSDWEIFELNDLIDPNRSIRYGIVQPGKFDPNGRFMVRGQDYSFGWVDPNQMFRVSPEVEERYKNARLTGADIILTIVGAGTGKLEVVPNWLDGSNITQTTARIAIDRSKADSNYCKFYFQTAAGKTQINLYIKGAAQPGLNIRDVRSFLIPLPPTKGEQTAIATALSDADILISSLEKLIAKKCNIKQGAMQNLLSSTGSDGKPKEGWEEKTVGEISKVGRGRVISHKEIDLAIEKKYPVYSSQTTNNGIMGNIDTYDFDGEYVTWTTDGENAGTVFYRNGKFNCTNVCGTIKLIKDNALFVSMLLGNTTAKYVSRNLANPKLMNDPMKRIEIILPPIEEQTRIATILSDMDGEISALETKLEKYRNVKLGMMQNLLTGKIRLK
jgi:type I restriction enzyme S subunit